MPLSPDFPNVKSTVAGIKWPSLQNSYTGNLMTILYQLEQSQWWNSEQILNMQLKQLNHLFVHAYNTIPFYKQKWSQNNVSPTRMVSKKMWKEIPILTRDEIQQQGKRLCSQNIPKTHGKVYPVTTSGSTGKPITVYKTDTSSLFWQAFGLREHYWHKRDFSLQFASIRSVPHRMRDKASYPDGIVSRSWGNPVGSLHNTGNGLLLDVFTLVSNQIEWITRHKPEYILTLASNAFALAEYCYNNGVRLPHLRHMRTYGEVVDEKVRHKCRQAWDVPVIDMYSSEEVGYMAIQCPEHEHYHLQSEAVYVEVINEKGEDCQPGEIGQIVVTPLHNFAMPLIRYAIGDYAEVGEPCPCGRGLPVVNRILGRTRNMFILPDGDQLWAPSPYESLIKIAPIKQYQIIQQTLFDIEFRLVLERPVTQEEEEKMREVLLSIFRSHPYKIKFSYPDKIERNRNGKFEDFVSKVALNS